MEKVFNTRKQAYNYMYDLCTHMDFVYDTQYHVYDFNIDWNSFTKAIDDSHKKSDISLLLGFRERGVQSGDSIAYWKKDILFKVELNYNSKEHKYIIKSIYND